MRRCAFLWAAAVVGATGCRQLIGIDDPSVTADAPVLDHLVTGVMQLRSSHLDMNGQVAIDLTKYAGPDLQVHVTLDDGTEPDVTVADDGTFQFARAAEDQRYRVVVTTPRVTSEYQLAAAELRLVERYVGRLDVTPVTQQTLIHFQGGMQPSTVATYALSTGIWSLTPLSSGSMPAIALDWKTVAAAPPGLLDASEHDQLYFANYASTSENVIALKSYATFGDVTLHDGDAITLNAQVQAIGADRCVQVTSLRADALNRLVAAAPLFGSAQRQADVRIADVPDFASPLGFALLQAIHIATDDSALQIEYMQPFPGTAIAFLDVALKRSVQLGDGTAIQFPISGMVAVPLDAMAACPNVTLQTTGGVPGTPAVAGTQLDADGATVEVGGAETVDVTWGLAVTGPVDTYTVQIYDVTSAAWHVTASVLTTDARAVFDRSVFEPDHLYMVEIAAATGAPGAAAGDLLTLDPKQVGYMGTASPTFRVRD